MTVLLKLFQVLSFNSIFMNKKDFFIIALKVIIYACTAILAVLGVSAMTSCNTSKSVDIVGRTHIYTVDTTIVNHNTFVSFPKVK